MSLTQLNTGFSRSVVTAQTGAYTITNLDPGLYTLTVDMAGFAPLTRADLQLVSGSEITLDFKMQVAGVAETLTVTGQAPLIERSSNRIGGTLSGREIEDVPANFRNIGALTQLVPGMTPNPAASTFEGGQVVANGTPAQSNVYLIDGMYNNDDRLGGSQGTQVRVVLDNIEEYQVLSNQYSAEYGGGAGAIINMVSRGGTNAFAGRAYTYFRDDKLNARGHFLPAAASKPDERTLQSGFAIGGPIVRNRAHFYFTYEKDNEDIAGQKRFPGQAAPLAVDFVGAFEVRATNYFGRGDLQLNDSNFLNARWVLETAPTRGEGFNTNNQTIDAQAWEADWDQLFNVAYTSVLTDRASNVLRVGRIGEQLGSGAQTYFNDDVSFRGFDGRDPFTIGQQNNHPSYVTGKGGNGANTRIRTYIIEDSFSYFIPSLWGGEHTLKTGAGFSYNSAPGRATVSSGAFRFPTDRPYNPSDSSTFPDQFTIDVGPPGGDFAVDSIDKRYNFFFEDKWRVASNLTFNVGLRYDHQQQIAASKDDWSPRGGFAWDMRGNGQTVLRGGVGRFYAYMPISVVLNLQTAAVQTLFPTITVTTASDTCRCVLVPSMISDSQGNPGVAVLSPAAIAFLTAQRASLLAGSTFSRDPRVDDPNRQMPYQNAWSFGLAHQVTPTTAVTVDYVANASRDQNGVVDINEPVNGVRPGVNTFDPTGILIPTVARGTAFRRVLQNQSNPAFDGDYKSFQMSLQKRLSNRVSGRVAYTAQESTYVGLGNPDTRRVWLDNDILADKGTFASNRTHVLAMSGAFNPWRTLTAAAVVSAISGARINETTGRDGNGDVDNTDRPIRGIDDLTLPIRSELDSQGRAVINGLEGPGSFLIDFSLRYSLPLGRAASSLDFFFDVFNLINRENLVAPTGNRASANFMVSTAAQFARQSQFGVRVRF
ncbi:MAG: hypothetical protein A3H97_21660 [Acidobacteria bacterium RIFCSPLOWO2_02_FULL_65_29]|nr:MAG: hypothetical protein A3H97_21660 [Acidobacteria bacterium RIFCSPLOWO2_02_FULL_65_29]